MQSEKRQVYVVGPSTLQNELIAAHLENHTEAKCCIARNLQEIPCSKCDCRKNERLILCDCVGHSREEVCQLIQSSTWRSLADDLLVLFNLSPNLAIENLGLRRGVRGFFYSSDCTENFLKGVRIILSDDLWASRHSLAELVRSKPMQKSGPTVTLTSRERQILEMIKHGESNKEIANRFFISPHTVKTHIYNIFKKVQVKNRLQAARWAEKYL